MKRLSIALVSATAAAALLTPAVAAQSQSYQTCEEERQDRQIAGALIGGILGAVIGNELADDSNNNRHSPDSHHYRDRRGHGYRRGHRRHRYEHRDRGNAEEVGTIAGAGVGAIIGASVAGGEECDPYRDRYQGKPDQYGYQNDNRYEDPRYEDRRYGDARYGEAPYAEDNRYYDERYFEDNGYRNADVYDDGSSGELLGGVQRVDTRTYNSNVANGRCEWTQSRQMGEFGQVVVEQVYMCQGTDGIWRPYDTYADN